MKGSLDIFDLLFTPLPQLLRQFGVKRLLVRNYDPSPCREILEVSYTQLRTKGEIYRQNVVPTLPFSELASGAVPAYSGVIAP